MNETVYKHNPLVIKALGGGNTFLKVIFANILPLAAVSCTLLSSCSDEPDNGSGTRPVVVSDSLCADDEWSDTIDISFSKRRIDARGPD